MIEYILFITAFNAIVLLIGKYKSPPLLVIVNVLITLVAMAVVEIMEY